eukprot:gene12840-15075_t
MATKKKKTLSSFGVFTQPGRFAKKAEKIRMEELQEDLMKRDLKTNVLDQPPNMTVGEVPDIEWWDAAILVNKKTESIQVVASAMEPKELMDSANWYLIEHPIQIAAPVNNAPPVTLNIQPPPKERKKIRRLRRAEMFAERQERVLNGLDEPPPNKVKMSNLMRVLTTQAVLDPTAIAATVREQSEARKASHDARNIERKLTPEQRREKKQAKLLVDAAREMRCALFRVGDLSHPLHRATIEKAARSSVATGCAVISGSFSLVAFEGGAKAIKKLKKLMNRIDWVSPPPITKETGVPEDFPKPPPGTINTAKLVWEGPIPKAQFKRFQMESCQSEAMARRFLQENSIPHFWDMAKNIESL